MAAGLSTVAFSGSTTNFVVIFWGCKSKLMSCRISVLSLHPPIKIKKLASCLINARGYSEPTRGTSLEC